MSNLKAGRETRSLFLLRESNNIYFFLPSTQKKIGCRYFLFKNQEGAARACLCRNTCPPCFLASVLPTAQTLAVPPVGRVLQAFEMQKHV